MGEYGIGLQSLSPVDFNRFVNNQSLFSPENSPRTMQDEILLEKSAAKQQQLSPSGNQISEQNGETVVKNGQSDVSAFQNDDKCSENITNSSSAPLEANSPLITSLASVSQNFWTPPQVQEDTYSHGPFQSINGTVSFQHLPPNAIVSAGNIMQAAQLSSQNLGQRRAITGQHNFPQRPVQQGMILNNAKNYPQWSNAHGQAHATISPWTQAQLQQHQRRSVPNMNIPAFAQLKNMKASFPQTQQSLSVIAPSKFRRSTSFPSQIHQATFAKPNVDYVGLDEVQRENYLSFQV